MKKMTNVLLALAAIIAYPTSSFAQNTFPASGNAGIGTGSNPTYPLTIAVSGTGSLGFGGNAINSAYTSSATGFVQAHAFTVNQTTANSAGSGVWSIDAGITTNHPAGTNVVLGIPVISIMQHASTGTMTEGRAVQGEILTAANCGTMTNGICFYATSSIINSQTATGQVTNGYGFYMAPFSAQFVNKYGFYINDATANNYIGGSLCIGTTAHQGYSLAVNGSAVFTKAVVQLYPWPDYVFKNDYHLPSLDSLKTYVRANNHLPDMPTEAEVRENGLDLGSNQAAMLKKIEELTLYIIRQNDRLEAQQAEIDQLKQQLGKPSKKGK